MRRVAAAIAIAMAACASQSPSAGGGGAALPASAPVAAIDARASAWTAIPGLGLRIGCVGKVEDMGSVALVTCGAGILSITRFAPAKKLDDAIAELRASSSYYLESTGTGETRTAHSYRHAHHNRGGSGENYWVDSAIEIGGRYSLCIAGGPGQTAADAARGGDLCATLAATP